MMDVIHVEIDGKLYPVKQPTIKTYIELTTLPDWDNEYEYAITIISSLTELPRQMIMDASFDSIIETSNYLTKLFLIQNKKFYPHFDFMGKTYKFIDLPNLTFGEFIDLDTFLQKTEIERKKELNTLMAFLYREADTNGKVSKYKSDEVEERAKLFLELDASYVFGAITFFFHLEKGLLNNILTSLPNTWILKVKLWIEIMRMSISSSIGVIYTPSSNSQTKTLQK